MYPILLSCVVMTLSLCRALTCGIQLKSLPLFARQPSEPNIHFALCKGVGKIARATVAYLLGGALIIYNIKQLRSGLQCHEDRQPDNIAQTNKPASPKFKHKLGQQHCPNPQTPAQKLGNDTALFVCFNVISPKIAIKTPCPHFKNRRSLWIQ